MLSEVQKKMKEKFKKALFPIRRLAARFILPDYNPLASPIPIVLAANYICVEEIDGDYLEFGCFRGASFIEAYKTILSAIDDWSSLKRISLVYTNEDQAKEAYKNVRKKQVRFFAFDSFEGLPEIEGIDKGHSKFTKGRYHCLLEEFKAILRRAGVNMDKVIIVPGFFDKTLNEETIKKYALKKAAIVMIDCDLYSSTRTALNFITNLIVEGTIIIFDDWFSFKANPNKGEQRACNEWLKENPQIKLIPYARFGLNQMSFIVNKDDSK